MRMKSTTVFLIQLLLWLSVILTGMPIASAAMLPNQQIQAVQALEDTLFAIHYDQEPIGDRVSRIEETVFGQAQTGSSIEARINKLQGSLSPKALGPLSSANKASNTQTNTNTSNGNGQQATNQNGANNNNQPRYSPMPANGNPSKIASTNGAGAKPLNNINKMQGTQNPGTAGTATPTAVAPGADETDYPTVTQMELKEFGKTFAKEDITQRLTRLETQVFKMPQAGSLSDRTDNLRLVVLGDTGQANHANGGYTGPGNYQPMPQGGNVGYNAYPQPPNYGGYSGATPYSGPTQPSYNSQAYTTPQGNYGAPNAPGTPLPGYGSTPVSNYPSNAVMPDNANEAPTPDMIAAIGEVEKEVLGSTYPSDPINARLDRVENKVFKATSPEMSSQDRIQRVIAVASAGGAPMTGKAKTKNALQTILPIILTILPLVLL